jgi:hypothetical protein
LLEGSGGQWILREGAIKGLKMFESLKLQSPLVNVVLFLASKGADKKGGQGLAMSQIYSSRDFTSLYLDFTALRIFHEKNSN